MTELIIWGKDDHQASLTKEDFRRACIALRESENRLLSAAFKAIDAGDLDANSRIEEAIEESRCLNRFIDFLAVWEGKDEE